MPHRVYSIEVFEGSFDVCPPFEDNVQNLITGSPTVDKDTLSLLTGMPEGLFDQKIIVVRENSDGSKVEATRYTRLQDKFRMYAIAENIRNVLSAYGIEVLVEEFVD